MHHDHHSNQHLGLASLHGLHAMEAAAQGHGFVAGISLMAGLIYYLMTRGA
jgi:hypothetical protein